MEEEIQARVFPGLQDEFVIREDRPIMILTVVAVAVVVVIATGLLINGWGTTTISAYVFALFIVALVLAFLIYLIKELIEWKVQIALSKEGIYLRGLGLYHWTLIERFSTNEDSDGGSKTLVLHFEDYADEEFGIGNLEYHKDDIVKLMLAYKGGSSAYYAGHFTK